jgi:hypothetical protein
MTCKDYNDLLEPIRTSFTELECAVELLEAARYKDIDIVRAVLAIMTVPPVLVPVPVPAPAPSGNDNDGAQQE